TPPGHTKRPPLRSTASKGEPSSDAGDILCHQRAARQDPFGLSGLFCEWWPIGKLGPTPAFLAMAIPLRVDPHRHRVPKASVLSKGSELRWRALWGGPGDNCPWLLRYP